MAINNISIAAAAVSSDGAATAAAAAAAAAGAVGAVSAAASCQQRWMWFWTLGIWCEDTVWLHCDTLVLFFAPGHLSCFALQPLT